ncbi:MAG: outer membrane beta-barrel protein [Flavobacterium sp.]
MIKSSFLDNGLKTVFIAIFLMFPVLFHAQQTPLPKAKTGAFWESVQFGGGLGVSVSKDYTDVTVAPSAIYNFNEYVSLGAGLQYSRLKQKNYYSSHVYGGSLIGLFNPIELVQLSLELEETNVNTKYFDLGGDLKKSFWNTGLYFGAGYHQDNVTIGGRINLLFDKEKDIYGSAFMPFVRVYF